MVWFKLDIAVLTEKPKTKLLHDAYCCSSEGLRLNFIVEAVINIKKQILKHRNAYLMAVFTGLSFLVP